MPETTENTNTNGKNGCSSCCFHTKRKRKSQEYVIAVDKVGTEASMVASLEDNTFYQELPTALSPGTCIQIQGLTKPDCSRFAVNFTCSKGPNTDIAFHFNPRLAQRYIVRNTQINGKWGEEETTSIAKYDLNRNKKFDLFIVTTDKEFLVSVNGRHVCGFIYRIPLSRITGIEVQGPVEVYGVEYTKVEIYPVVSPQHAPLTVPVGSTGQDKDVAAVQQLDMPITAILPEGFQQGWQLEICGRVKILPHAFYINLQKGTQIWPHPLIPLHLNPRFTAVHGNHLFVRNSWAEGTWGQEERTPGHQFTPGAPFCIAIRKHDTFFGVWVDGRLVGEFKFRTKVDGIDAVYIHGDVVIKSLYMRTQVDDRYFSRDNLNKENLSL